MRTDVKVCIGVTIGVIVLLAVSYWVFKAPVLGAMSIFGLAAAVFLPTYVLHRVRTNDGVRGYESDVRTLVGRYEGRLRELSSLLEDSDIDEASLRYLDEDSAERLKALAKAMEESGFKKDTVLSYLRAVKGELKSIGKAFTQDSAATCRKRSGIM